MTAALETATSQTDVVIVGCGPVGAMLGCLLGLQGITTTILDRETDIYDLPRAVHFDDEVMRLLQTIGVADAMQPQVHVSPGMKFVDANGRVLLDWSRPQAIGPHGWYASYRFHQPDLERVLRNRLSSLPSVTFRTQADVQAIDEHAGFNLVHYRDLASGTRRTCKAGYVVGCDGARSLVRRLIGGAMEDLGFHERWLVVDAILKRPRPDLGDYSLQFCDPKRPATYVRGVGDRRRWEISVRPDEDGDAAVVQSNVFKLLAPWISPDDATLERAVIYTFHSTIAREWRRQRLLLAGDAAHLTPPFLGQGMCAGMRDAANLGWKLGRVLRGLDADDLLASYQSERLPHVREYIELAVRLGGLINTKAMEAAVPGAALTGGKPVRMSSIKPLLGPGRAAGCTRLTGHLAPQPMLPGACRFDDIVGYKYALLAQPDVITALSQEERKRLTDRDVVVVPADSADADAWLQSSGAIAAVLRPDRYILGTAEDASELQALIAGI